MFEFHLGAKLHISSDILSGGLFITGKAGQGRSTMLMQLALELLKNKQAGLFFDPYGSQSKHLKKLIKSDGAKKQAVFLDIKDDLDQIEAHLNDQKLIFISADRLKEGFWSTVKEGGKLLKSYLPKLASGQWLVICDEAFSLLSDDLFSSCLDLMQRDIRLALSDQSFNMLSEEQRQKFGKKIKNYIVYKPQNIDAVMLAKEKSQFDPEQMKGIKQYHFQALLDDRIEYDASKWPLEST